MRWRHASQRPGRADHRRGAIDRQNENESDSNVSGSHPKRIIVGISGASGIIYGIRALEMLRRVGIETHLVMSKAAEMTLAYETEYKAKDVRELASIYHPVGDIGASISSGSFHTLGMVIAPCSIRTMSEIATGITGSLMSRAADVVLKERRRLVLGIRETPLHTGHLRTLTQLSEMGAVVCPVVPAFYNRPETLDDIVNHTVGRMLDLFDIDVGILKRWKTDE
jgi:4-hydroxy-3-polyprenylbenzoate decarboxylase